MLASGRSSNGYYRVMAFWEHALQEPDVPRAEPEGFIERMFLCAPVRRQPIRRHRIGSTEGFHVPPSTCCRSLAHIPRQYCEHALAGHGGYLLPGVALHLVEKEAPYGVLVSQNARPLAGHRAQLAEFRWRQDERTNTVQTKCSLRLPLAVVVLIQVCIASG